MVDEPYIPGHESSGIVVETGNDVRGFTNGEKVVIEPGISCRKCQFCKEEKYNLCPDVIFLSAPPVNGTFCEYVAVPSDFVFKIPEDISLEHGSIVEPLAGGVHACNRGRLTAGMTAAVLGVGPIGLLTLQAAKAFGATDVIAIDLIEERLKLADNPGASYTINVKDQDICKAIKDYTGSHGVDIVFETAGNVQASQMTVDIVSRGGTVVHVGWPDPGEFPYGIETVMEKELDIRGVNRYANAYPPAISLIKDGKIEIDQLITHTFTLDKIKEAFDFVSSLILPGIGS